MIDLSAEIKRYLDSRHSESLEKKREMAELSAEIERLLGTLTFDPDMAFQSLAEHKQRISQAGFLHDALLDCAAAYSAENELLVFENEQLQKQLEVYEKIGNLQGALLDRSQAEAKELSQLHDLLLKVQGTLMRREGVIHGRKVGSTIAGRKAADAKHASPGGSRDKRDHIRKIWASGKYSSRDICAEQECAALEISYSTARKHLRGTPDPS